MCVCVCVCVCVCARVRVCAHSVLGEGDLDFLALGFPIFSSFVFPWGSPGNTWVVSGAVEFLFLFLEFSGQISSSCHFFITSFPPFSAGWQPLGCVSSKVPEL